MQSAGSPYAAMLDMIQAHRRSTAVCAVAKLGIADYLESGPKTTTELASLMNVREDPLYRVLRALAGFGIFEEGENRTFCQTPLSELLRTHATPTLRYAAMMQMDDWQFRTFQTMGSTIENGRPAMENLFGKRFFEYLAEHPDLEFRFNRAMTDLSSGDAPALVAAYDFSEFDHVIDIAGGTGNMLGAILGSAPGVRGTLFDRASVIEQAKADRILSPFAARCQFVSGDFFERVPEGAGGYVLKHIIHNWDDEPALRILRNCRRAMRPGSKLVVADRVIGPPNEPDPGKFYDLTMMLILGGRERTEPEWKALLSAAGFRIVHIIPTACPLSIIESTPV